MEFDDHDTMHRICAERLGAGPGSQFARMARPGFRLGRPAGAAAATGQCRLGGPALLAPGTVWPVYGGFPLSLHAVLDLDALAPWLGDSLPPRRGLLNVFYLDPGVPYDQYTHLDHSGSEVCRVLPADPATAVEAPAPAPARSYPATPLHAAPAVMLPDCWDVQDDDVAYDEDQHWGATSLILDTMGDIDANTAGAHCAFGWPDTSYSSPVTSRDADGPAVHLLQLAEDAELGWGWGDAGTMYFTIPAGAFAAGDFHAATAELRCC